RNPLAERPNGPPLECGRGRNDRGNGRQGPHGFAALRSEIGKRLHGTSISQAVDGCRAGRFSWARAGIAVRFVARQASRSPGSASRSIGGEDGERRKSQRGGEAQQLGRRVYEPGAIRAGAEAL